MKGEGLMADEVIKWLAAFIIATIVTILSVFLLYILIGGLVIVIRG